MFLWIVRITYLWSSVCSTACVAVCCSVLQCVAACCNVLQYVAVCCQPPLTAHDWIVSVPWLPNRCVLQCVAVCCSVLQCFAVCYSVLQCVAVCCSVLQTTTHCKHLNSPTTHFTSLNTQRLMAIQKKKILALYIFWNFVGKKKFSRIYIHIYMYIYTWILYARTHTHTCTHTHMHACTDTDTDTDTDTNIDTDTCTHKHTHQALHMFCCQQLLDVANLKFVHFRALLLRDFFQNFRLIFVHFDRVYSWALLSS